MSGLKGPGKWRSLLCKGRRCVPQNSQVGSKEPIVCEPHVPVQFKMPSCCHGCLTGLPELYRNMPSSEMATTCLWCEVGRRSQTQRRQWFGASAPAQHAGHAVMLWVFQYAAVCQVTTEGDTDTVQTATVGSAADSWGLKTPSHIREPTYLGRVGE